MATGGEDQDDAWGGPHHPQQYVAQHFEMVGYLNGKSYIWMDGTSSNTFLISWIQEEKHLEHYEAVKLNPPLSKVMPNTEIGWWVQSESFSILCFQWD